MADKSDTFAAHYRMFGRCNAWANVDLWYFQRLAAVKSA
jgi:hypothetical protein